jgi:hypothetical protein
MVPDGINYSDAMLKYSRPGSEKDSIYLDGDLLGSAGPQDTDPFDATTYSIPLGDIAPGMHTLRIVGEDSPDCVDGENCIGGKPDGYHWVDALKLTAGITCPAGIPGDAGAPSITGVDWQLHPSNSLIADFEVSVDSESSVWIEYQPVSGDTGILSTARSAMSDDDHEVEVMRMLADMQYCYQVFAEDDDGLVSDSFAGTFRTDPLPESLEPSKFRLVSGQPTTYPITMVDHETDNFEGAVVLDRSGNVVWYLDDFPAQDIVQDPVTLNLLANGDNITEMTPSGEFVRQSPGVCAIPLTDPNQGIVQGGVHHEVLAPQGDTVLYIGHVIKDPFNDPNRIQLGDSIRQWNRATNEDVQVWDPFEFLDPINDRTESSNLTTGTICTVVGPEDWTHGNSLQVVPDGNARPDEDGNIVMSVRDVNQIISIESDFSGLVWRLGDATHTGTPTSDFTFPDLSDQFYREHSARQLPNGNILLFDNGTFRPESEGGEYSRALELELDMTAMTATKVWEYRHTPDLFARIVSSVARLDNGNTVVMFGSMTGDACCRIATLVEADDQPSANAHTVIEISSPGMPNTYRAHPLQTINGEFEK